MANFRPWARIIVCGGRDLVNATAFGMTMDIFIQLHGMSRLVMHGGARGADALANAWAEHHGVQVIAVPANWKGEGLRAGPIRNQLMLDLVKPDFVVALPGGPGTADMVRRAKEAGISIFEG